MHSNEHTRICNLRDAVLHSESSICTERAKIVTQVYKENESAPVVIKRALALKKILEDMSIFISDNELIVGNHSSKLRAAPIFPEYAVDWILDELDEFEKRPGDVFTISNEQKKELTEICQYWKGKTLKDKGLALIPEDSRVLYDIGVIRAEGNLTSGDGHIAVNFEKVLQKGINGIRQEAESKLKSLDFTDYKQLKQKYFLDAVIIVLQAVETFAKRFAKLALSLSEAEGDPQRKKELQKISEICSRIPMQPCQSFHEAVQCVWFIQLILQIESNGHSVSLGRLDQYLYPYYKKDAKNGAITEKEAIELLCNLWIKMYSINKIRPWSHTKFSAGSPLYQNVTIGGQTADGKDAVNELSYLVLKSVSVTKLTQPNLSVRYHTNMTDNFLKSCIDVIKLGFGMPAFNNDEIVIPALMDLGVSKEDAYNYSAIGCIEVAVPGKWGYRCTGMSFLNFAKVLMVALNNGVDNVSGTKLLEGKGNLTDFNSFDEVFSVWSEYVRYFTRHHVIIDSCVDMALEELCPDILCSTLVDDCIERGKHLKEGGAVYDYISGLQVGIANLGNSLAAIKKLVFEDKLITKEELVQALENNYEGMEGERIRQLILNKAPKYGNDDDYVDLLLRDAYMVYIDEISKYNNTRFGRGPIGGKYYAGTSSISANVPSGAVVHATPDGRKAFSPLAEGCSPSSGTDTSGPTAVFKSVAKLPTEKIVGGVLLNQKLPPFTLKKERDIEKLLKLIRTFFSELKGWHVQYNVVDKETLLDAQKNPEKHRDLIVRVAGYSAFFTVLSPETQNDIIARTEHTL